MDFMSESHVKMVLVRLDIDVKMQLEVSSTKFIFRKFGSVRLHRDRKRNKLTLACDDFQPLGAYLPNLLSGSTKRYSPSVNSTKKNELIN